MTDLWECYEPEDEYMEPDPELAPIPCPTCKGSGVVNPLTAPSWYFCVAATTCPACDGSGEWQ
jgi:DnaJ-class molecular chaperone